MYLPGKYIFFVFLGKKGDHDVLHHDLLGGVGRPLANRNDRSGDRKRSVRRHLGRRDRALVLHGDGCDWRPNACHSVRSCLLFV